MAGQSDGWTTTARLLRRTGFGVTGAQVDAVAKQNWPDYVDAAYVRTRTRTRAR